MIWVSPVKNYTQTTTTEEVFTSRFFSQEETLNHKITRESKNNGKQSCKLLRKNDAKTLTLRQLTRSNTRMIMYEPKSQRLAKPIMYVFDIFVRAAIEIQRISRGYFSRKKYGSLNEIKENIIKIQRLYRTYRSTRKSRINRSFAKLNELQRIIDKTLKNFECVNIK